MFTFTKQPPNSAQSNEQDDHHSYNKVRDPENIDGDTDENDQ